MTENPKKELKTLKHAASPTEKSPYDEETLRTAVREASKHIPAQILPPDLQKAIAKLSQTYASLDAPLLSKLSDLHKLTILKSPTGPTLFKHQAPILGSISAQKLPVEILKTASQAVSATPSIRVPENIQKTISNLNKNGTLTNTALCSTGADHNSDMASLLDINLGEFTQSKQQVLAETNARAIGEVIQEILKQQNKTADTRRKEDNRRLWRIAFVTIIGSGITSAIGGWAVSHFLK